MHFFHTLFFKLLIALLLTSVIPLSIVGLIMYEKASSDMRENINYHADLTIDQKVDILNETYSSLVRMSEGITTSLVFTEFSENESIGINQQLYIEIDQLMNSIQQIVPQAEGITMINQEGFIYYYGYSLDRSVTAEDITQSAWFPITNKDFTPKVSVPHSRPYSRLDPTDTVYSFVLKAWDNKLRTSSLIIIDFKSDLISQTLNRSNEIETASGSMIYGDQGIILPTHEEALPLALVKEAASGSTIQAEDGSSFLIYKRELPDIGWSIVEYFSVDILYSSISEMKNVAVATIFINIFACIFASLFISHKIAKPIRRMRMKMDEVEKGSLEKGFFSSSKDEIGDLGRGFNHMLGQIQLLLTSVAHEEKLKKEAEMTALQLQINPHFLYNTLESINAIARKKKEPEISRLIVLLGRLLRLSISSFEEHVTLKQELDYIKYYLEIQKTRMRDRLHYTIDLDSDIEQSITVKWILQPIVENAIVHGLDPKNGGEINIKGTSSNGLIKLIVIDNGQGMDEETLTDLKNKLSHTAEELTKYKQKVGIFNVQARIRLYYGKPYGIEIESIKDVGTKVVITIPQ